MARLFKSNGDIDEIKPANGSNFSIEELEAVVNGSIEIVHLYAGEVMVINEDHRHSGTPLNGAATYVYGIGTRCSDKIYGDVLICKRIEICDDEDRPGRIKQLKADFELIACRYTEELNAEFDLVPEEGWWIGDEIGGMYCNGDAFSVTFEDMVFIVNTGISKDEYLEWVEYSLWAHEFGQVVPNLKSWHAGCPRHDKKTMKRLINLKQELTTQINELTKKA